MNPYVYEFNFSSILKTVVQTVKRSGLGQGVTLIMILTMTTMKMTVNQVVGVIQALDQEVEGNLQSLCWVFIILTCIYLLFSLLYCDGIKTKKGFGSTYIIETFDGCHSFLHMPIVISINHCLLVNSFIIS